MTTIGEAIKDVREYRGLTADALDARCELPAGTCLRYEQQAPEIERWGRVLASIAMMLVVPSPWLISPSGLSADCADGQCGMLVRQWRATRDLTHTQAAVACGLTPQAWLAMEGGGSELERCGRALLRISEALDVPLFELIAPS